MNVADLEFRKLFGKCFLVEAWVSSRTGNGTYIRNQLRLIGLEKFYESLEASGGVTDCQDGSFPVPRQWLQTTFSTESFSTITETLPIPPHAPQGLDPGCAMDCLRKAGSYPD